MKQLIFDIVHHLFNRNIGLEFKITEGFLFDITIAAVIEKGKIIHINIFDIEKGDYILGYDDGGVYIKCENNLIIFELEQKIRKTLVFGENVKILTDMKTPNPNTYIKDFNKFQ
jgi:hypothetical protein